MTDMRTVKIMSRYLLLNDKAYNRDLELYLPWQQIVAIAGINLDSVLSQDIPRVAIGDINNCEFDYILVLTEGRYDRIREYLWGELGISEDKIIIASSLMQPCKLRLCQAVRYFADYIVQKKYTKLIDYYPSNITSVFATREEMNLPNDVIIDAVYDSMNIAKTNIYGNVCAYGNHDAILLWDRVDLLGKFLEVVREQNCSLLLYSNYNKKTAEDINTILSQNADDIKVHQWTEEFGWFWCIENNRDAETVNDIGIYVVTHKPYNLEREGIYRPICVGKYRNEDFVNDSTGDNIAEYNPVINECTAMYWVWKNATEDIVGINHYRRYFLNDQLYGRWNVLDKKHIEEYLDEYDIVVSEQVSNSYISMGDYLKLVVSDEACQNVFALFEEAIRNKQPDYLDQLYTVWNGNFMFVCNMMVTSKKIYDRYCEWLFSFLLDVADQVDLDKYDNYSKRIVGFIAERMLTVWLIKQNYKIKELPVLTGNQILGSDACYIPVSTWTTEVRASVFEILSGLEIIHNNIVESDRIKQQELLKLCQESAIAIGDILEQHAVRERRVIAFLEDYCEIIYTLSTQETVNDTDMEILKDAFRKIFASIYVIRTVL